MGSVLLSHENRFSWFVVSPGLMPVCMKMEWKSVCLSFLPKARRASCLHLLSLTKFGITEENQDGSLVSQVVDLRRRSVACNRSVALLPCCMQHLDVSTTSRTSPGGESTTMGLISVHPETTLGYESRLAE